MADARILRAARARIADPAKWAQKTYACTATGASCGPSSPECVCWCGMGSLFAEGVPRDGKEVDALVEAAALHFGFAPEDVNDRLGHAAVLAMYDAAIASAEASA